MKNNYEFNPRQFIKIIGAIVLLIITGLLLLNSCTTVPAGHVGVVSFFGDVRDQALNPGVHFTNPFNTIHVMDCRIQKDNNAQKAASKDMQEVEVSLGINYHLKPDGAVLVFKTIGSDWAARIIPNAESETLKAEVAHYNASEILQERVSIKAKVEGTLSTWLAKYGIQLDEVSIANIKFSAEYEDAIERKQVEEQTALQRVYQLQTAQKDAEIAKVKASGEALAVIETAKGYAESTVIRAEAQASANRKIAESLSGEAGDRVVLIQQIEKWNGTLPTTLAGDDGISIFVK